MAQLWHRQKFFCAGSLISRQWVLTGAACTSGMNTIQPDIKVRLGSRYLYRQNNSSLVFGVSQVITHQNHNFTTNNYDFSLLKLATPVDLAANPYIR